MNIPRWGVILGISLTVPLTAAAQDNRFRSVLQAFGQGISFQFSPV